jgi:hypothetical protein
MEEVHEKAMIKGDRASGMHISGVVMKTTMVIVTSIVSCTRNLLRWQMFGDNVPVFTQMVAMGSEGDVDCDGYFTMYMHTKSLFIHIYVCICIYIYFFPKVNYSSMKLGEK